MTQSLRPESVFVYNGLSLYSNILTPPYYNGHTYSTTAVQHIGRYNPLVQLFVLFNSFQIVK